jgi:hypothetical protein
MAGGAGICVAKPPSRDVVQAPYTPRTRWRARGSHSTHRGCLSCWRKRFKISLEVAALDVAMPFTVVLNGDATILAPVVADDLVEIDRHNAWQYVRLIRHASRWRCAHSRGGA